MLYTRYETPTRYYKIYLQQDLLEDWIVTCAYGGKNSKLGQVKSFPYPTYDEALKKFKAISAKRQQRKYKLIESEEK